MALHMYYLVRSIWGLLSSKFGHRFFVATEYTMKKEYQGRGTPHWHIAAWVVCTGLLADLEGRIANGVKKGMSALVQFLNLVFDCDIDVQVGNGRLNYINGYVSKDHDAVDVGLGEYVQKNATAPWLAAYRLLSKGSPSIPEVAIRMAQLPEMDRSYWHVLLYPPQPSQMVELEGRMANFSARMYGIYLQEMRGLVAASVVIDVSFLAWHRTREYDPQSSTYVFRGRADKQYASKTMVVACRYWYELTDGFWGQLVLTQIPHLHARTSCRSDSTWYVWRTLQAC